MKKPNRILEAVLVMAMLIATLALPACKTARLEPGGVYAPTNELGQVVYADTGLALADASYQLAYDTVSAVLKFERDNRATIWALSPEVKKALDKVREQGNALNLRWAEARYLYKQNPTPAGLTALQTILAEIQRLVPVAQQQLAPVTSTLTQQP